MAKAEAERLDLVSLMVRLRIVTFDSERRHQRSEGAAWKGRFGAGRDVAGTGVGR